MANPIERLLHGLIAQAGISPEMIVQAYQTVMAWQGEVTAFKHTAAATVGHFNNRLDAIERQLSDLTFTLQQLGASQRAANVPLVVNPDAVPTITPMNGELKHE